MGLLDSAAKTILREAPEDLVSLCPAFAGLRVARATAGEPARAAISLAMDKLLTVELDEGVAPVRLHVEVEANWSARVPRRVFEYWSLGHREHDELLSLVICLEPGNKQGPPRRSYERRVRGQLVVRFAFELVALWRVPPERLLDPTRPGLLPLVPYAARASEQHVEQALAVLERVEPEERRTELQAALSVFADNVFPEIDWVGRIPMEALMTSKLWERATEAGMREGFGRQLVRRLGDRGEALRPRLDQASGAVLERIGDLLVDSWRDEELLAELDRLLPPLGAPSERRQPGT